MSAKGCVLESSLGCPNRIIKPFFHWRDGKMCWGCRICLWSVEHHLVFKAANQDSVEALERPYTCSELQTTNDFLSEKMTKRVTVVHVHQMTLWLLELEHSGGE